MLFLISDFQRALKEANSKLSKELFVLSFDECSQQASKLKSPAKDHFAEFAKENIDMPEVQSIVEEAFNSFVERNLLQYEGIEHLQIGFVGSVAVSFEQQIRNVLRRHFDSDIVFVTSPIDGLVKNIIDRDES